MTTLRSYDLNGKKLSFSNWISNLSPQETPFVSMTGKESIDQTLFQWQTDNLSVAGENSVIEGASAATIKLTSTEVLNNVTQILRKVVKVSETANALANYGRGKELQYQMEKAGQEIKRDLEWAFLNNEAKVDGSSATARQTAGFKGLVAALDTASKETGAIVHKNYKEALPTEADIFDLTYNLYLAGSQADTIMYPPAFASVFSALQEKSDGSRKRIFKDTPKFSVEVSTLIDPLGQEYKLIPNRWMPTGNIYFFNSDDWTQMVLRSPSRTKLSKGGSYEKWMIEMEVGLRHRHPYASGILEHHTARVLRAILDSTKNFINGKAFKAGDAVNVALGGVLATTHTLVSSFTRGASVLADEVADIAVYKGNSVFLRKSNIPLGTEVNLELFSMISASDAGEYKILIQTDSYYEELPFTVVVDAPISSGGEEEIFCTVENLIQSVTSNGGIDMMNFTISFEVESGATIPNFATVVVKDGALGGTISLVKRGSGNDLSVLKRTMVAVNRSNRFDLEKADDSDSGVYIFMVEKDKCTQASEPFTISVTAPDEQPIVPSSTKINNIVLNESGTNEIAVKEGDVIPVSIDLDSGFAGSTIEVTLGSYAPAIASKSNAVAGTNTFNMTIQKNYHEQIYFLKVTTPSGDNMCFSPSFHFNVMVVPDPGITPVANIFEPQHSYVGNANLEADGVINVVKKSTIDLGSYIVMHQNDPSKTIAYKLVSTNGAPDIPLKIINGNTTYKYLDKTAAGGWTTSQSGEYVIRATDNGNYQDSVKFFLKIVP